MHTAPIHHPYSGLLLSTDSSQEAFVLLYGEVTARIIAELEQGVIPWTKPWKTSKANRGGILPINAITGRSYRGVNVVILWSEKDAKAYPTSEWLTYKQAQEAGGQVRKGERSTEVVFTKKLTIKDKDTDEEKQISMLRGYRVFNRAQVDGLPDPKPVDQLPLEQRDERLTQFIQATDARVQHGGNEACFIPSLDLIQMPPYGSFKTTEGYWSTHLHEIIHWSGASHRLNRDLSGRFGTQRYAAEELIAELGAAFLCAHLGVQGDLRHASYLQTWLTLLRSDDRAIFTAAAHAQKAADYIRQITGEPIEE